jgi:Domain of unknown function (DUF4276)
LRTACRRGFSEFLKKAGLSGRMPRIIACGRRENAFDSFRTAMRSPRQGAPLLLVDAEGAVEPPGGWEHLSARDGWSRPRDASDDMCHFMVQCMEAWFLADRSALAAFFGHGFQPGALPGNLQLEEISKRDVLAGLEQASRNAPRGPYHKARHGFVILAKIDPSAVERSAPHAARLLAKLRET